MMDTFIRYVAFGLILAAMFAAISTPISPVRARDFFVEVMPISAPGTANCPDTSY